VSTPGSARAGWPAGRPRVVATDLDGTLLDRRGTVSARTDAALRLAVAAGARVLLVTARPPRWMAPVLAQLSGAYLTICSNGGAVRTPDGGVEQLRPIAPDLVLTLAARLRAIVPQMAFAVETDGGLGHEPAFAPADFDPPSGDPGRQCAALPELLARPAFKLLGKYSTLTGEALHARAVPAVAGLAEPTYSGADGLLEIAAPGVTKASALATWCAAHGYQPADVIAFGDMPNDLPMLRWAGQGVAMGNAHPDVLAAADRHTAGNDADGVALVLESCFA
jgi:hydroxymethylpyrimidine pyrophosphatase-like HAD family hydrolase